MQVRAYLSFRAALAGVRGGRAGEAIDRELARCDLASVASKRIGALSKGFRQRVGLAAALVHDPAVVILDEPSNGLDPSQILQFRTLIGALARERTMLISSHILAEVQKICTRVILMSGGKVRADGTPESLARRVGTRRSFLVSFTDSEHQVALEMLRAIPDVHDVNPILRPGEARFDVLGADMDLRHRIAHAARDKGLLILELSEQMPSLEETFMQLVAAPGAAP